MTKLDKAFEILRRDILAADRKVLKQVRADLNAWYDLTEGWRDGEGNNLEYDEFSQECDAIFDSITNLLGAAVKARRRKGNANL